MGLGSFIGAGRSLETALQRVELAERLGYESVYVTHIAARDSVTTLMAYAARSERVRLGTGVLPIYSRTPVATAQSYATLDEHSDGRAVCGLGVSHRPTVEGWYGQTIDKPLREMREYVGIVRAIFRGEDPPQGERFRSYFHFMGYEARPDLPIYVAGLSPGMLRLAGEIADGVMLWLCNPDYIRDVVVPTVAEGREKAGKTLDGFDIVAAVPAAVTGEPDEARARLRQELVPYFSLPFYRAMLERSGYEADVQGFDAGMQNGGPEAAVAAISDRFLSRLAAIGSPEEATESVRRYRDAGATSPCVGGIARTDFDATLEALAGSLSA
jgi:alkanesulfonate monooxygenase SsuD/methylene tetrahydromethanopterin reductase-like flavin-dependent oxidoreductase (luciferase family)